MPTRDPYGLISSGLPPELAAEMMGIKGREAIAQALFKQSQGEIEAPQVKGRFQGAISPFQGLAKMAQAYVGSQGIQDASKAYAGLGGKYNKGVTDALLNYQQSRTGTPAISGTMVPQEGAMGETLPPMEQGGKAAIEGNPRKAIIDALTNPYIRTNPSVLKDLEQWEKPRNVRTVHQGDIDIQQEYQPDGTWKKIGEGPRFAKQIGPTINQEAPVTPVTIQDPTDPNKTIIVDGRSGRTIGKGPKLTQVGGAEQKLTLGLPQARLRVESMTQNLDRLDTAMNSLHDDKGVSNITGTIMGRTPNVLNKATGAQAQLDSIKSQIFQSSLQAMREASKTGGAVGNVSDREGDKLERTIAALDQAQGTADFKKQLKKAIEQVRMSKSLINAAFTEQYGGIEGFQKDTASTIPGLSPEGTAAYEKYRAK